LAASLLDQTPPSKEAHQVWFSKRLADPNTRIWIIESHGAAAGQIRFEDKGADIEVSISLDRAYRGRGIARTGLLMALKEVKIFWPRRRLTAKVRHGNISSQRLFRSCGFAIAERTAEIAIYAADLDQGADE
jgi:RimJ/RimL family protein N-acetyltransferase